MDKLLFHIGYHKTGTTWLQKNVFVSTSKVFFPLNADRNKLAKLFVSGRDGFVLSPFATNKVEILKEFIELTKNRKDKSKTLVLSFERLSGHPHSAGLDSKRIAERINGVFPSAKVLIVIREQRSFILSIYFQYLLKGGVHSLKKYLNIVYDKKRSYFSPNHINYVPLIKEYYNLFGKENVKVLPYEMFKRTPVEFINSISAFINANIEIDESAFENYSNQTNRTIVRFYFRFLNYFIFSNSLNNYSFLKNKFSKKLSLFFKSIVSMLIPKKWDKRLNLKLAAYIEQWVGDRYASSNVELSKLIDIDLTKYGYT